MGAERIEVLRSKFLKVFSRVPLELRNEIIAVLDNEAITWSVANIEVKGKTKKGDKILELMDYLKILGD
jgi:hypothetical protein